jgi:transcriptional regulator with XRE-family HTH domain
MVRTNLSDAVAAMLANYTDMTERQAEALTLRKIRGISRSDVADHLGITESSVDSRVQSAKENFRMPNITEIRRERQSETGIEEKEAIFARFENGAKLRYVRQEDGAVRQDIYRFDDTQSVYRAAVIDRENPEEQGCIDAYLTTSLEVYSDMDNPDDMTGDWPDLSESLFGTREIRGGWGK